MLELDSLNTLELDENIESYFYNIKKLNFQSIFMFMIVLLKIVLHFFHKNQINFNFSSLYFVPNKITTVWAQSTL